MAPHRPLTACIISLLAFCVDAQSPAETAMQELQDRVVLLEAQIDALAAPLERAKLGLVQEQLERFGLPTTAEGDTLVLHDGHALAWDGRAAHPRWTAHLLLPDILAGNLARLDSFTTDPKIPGTRDLRAHYWNSGYDRGHLVPSADLRWSGTALPATYHYSNIAPQHPTLNRGTWADLEDWGRRSVHYSGERTWVITGTLPGTAMLTSPQAKERISIPTAFYKIYARPDATPPYGIAFLMPNASADASYLSYAVPIDSIQRITGIDFFPLLPTDVAQQVEQRFDTRQWYSTNDPFHGETAPLPAPLPGGRFNTAQARYHVGRSITVCGKVVSTRLTRSAKALYLNFDKPHPHQDFYATVWDYNGPNFHYDVATYLMDRVVCVTGKVTLYDDIPRISVNNEKAITFWDDIQSGNIR